MDQKPDAGYQRYSTGFLYAACTILLLAILLVDLAVPAGIAVGVLYLAVILTALRLPGDSATLLFAFISTLLIIAALFFKPPMEEVWKVAYNRGIALLTVWIIAWFGLQRKKAERQRHQVLREREKALEEVKILHGLLPICASCKRIKNDQGSWMQIESYLKQHSEAEFTHGLCPECAERLYPEVFKKPGPPADISP